MEISKQELSIINGKLEGQAKYWNGCSYGLVGPLPASSFGIPLRTAIGDLVDINNPDIKMLDFGCGIGRVYNSLLPKCSYVGVDISKHYLDQFKRTNPDVETILLNEQSLPFSNNYFDLIIAYSVLTHIPIDEQSYFIMYELHRVLKETGIALVSVFINQDKRANWVIYTDTEWNELITDVGFHTISEMDVNETPPYHQTLQTLGK